MYYAVADVSRVAFGGSSLRLIDQHGTMLSGARLLATSSMSIKTKQPNGSIPSINHKLMEAVLFSGETGP